jgi:hypothetical protein
MFKQLLKLFVDRQKAEPQEEGKRITERLHELSVDVKKPTSNSDSDRGLTEPKAG